uniref:soluble epoxide hydrolase n=1 Tax=Brassica campestris TaxID=3711 RepID=M4FCQ7_BRACM
MTSEVREKKIKTNGIWLNVAEKGDEGEPLVLLLHGFPETWFSWRHQIDFLSSHGYHVVAPDLRGYADSDSPPTHESYTVSHLVADVIGLLDHYGTAQAFVAGHDWGAIIGWSLCLFRPDRVKGFVSLSVPYSPRDPNLKPSDLFKSFGDGLYITQFQEPGRAEAAFAKHDCLTVMKKFLLTTRSDFWVAPPNTEIIDDLEVPSTLPDWITEEEIQVYADKFQKSGFTGPLNYYRAMDLKLQELEILAPWQGYKIVIPTKFIAGDKDIGNEGANGTIKYVKGEMFKSIVPNLEVVVIEDGHHFIQQEKSERVSQEILSFFNKLRNITE